MENANPSLNQCVILADNLKQTAIGTEFETDKLWSTLHENLTYAQYKFFYAMLYQKRLEPIKEQLTFWGIKASRPTL